MNSYCTDCGFHLRHDPVQDWFRCPNCDKVYSALHVTEAVDPLIRHGERCDRCGGTGVIEHEFVERRPYGDTYAEERLVEILDCEECDGKGYELDERGKACVICGRDIPDGTGVLVNGWRVHEDFSCSTDEPPTLNGWDS